MIRYIYIDLYGLNILILLSIYVISHTFESKLSQISALKMKIGNILNDGKLFPFAARGGGGGGGKSDFFQERVLRDFRVH